MDPIESFFNFYLGRELGVCGELLYNGFNSLENNSPVIRKEDELTYLNEGYAFSFLINTSVAFERLEKIILLFLINQESPNKIASFLNIKMKSNFSDDDVFKNNIFEYVDDMSAFSKPETKRLMEHRNLNIVAYINQLKSKTIELNTDENHLLNILDTFYKSFRYGRFHPKDFSVGGYGPDNKLLNDLLTHWEQNDEPSTRDKEKNLYDLGKCINKLAKKYYAIIREFAYKMNVYTYELHDDSNAQTVFLNIDDSLHDIFIQKRITREELLYNLAYNQIKKIAGDEIPDKLPIEFDIIEDFLLYGDDNYFTDSVNETLNIALNDDDDDYDSYYNKEKIIEREKHIHQLLLMFSNMQRI